MIIEVKMFKTSDGQVHETRQLALARERFMGLSGVLDKALCLRDVDSDEIVKWISDNRAQVREFLDALDAKDA